MNDISIMFTDLKYAESYNAAVASVAAERKYLAVTEGFPLDMTRKWMIPYTESSGAQYFAVNENDRVVGWCDITPVGRAFFKHRGELGIGLLSEFRNKGLGTLLFRACLEHVRKQGLERVDLEVYAGNKAAVSFYKKMGFEVEGVMRKGKKDRDKYDDIIRMGLFV